jgi:hypothetical protein
MFHASQKNVSWHVLSQAAYSPEIKTTQKLEIVYSVKKYVFEDVRVRAMPDSDGSTRWRNFLLSHSLP